MGIDKWLVTIGSISGVIFTYWFFLMKKDAPAVTVETESIDIMVEGGYSPSSIAVSKGKTVTLNFFRKDRSSCLEEVVIPDFSIRKQLLLNKTTPITITPKQPGTFEISCGMHMFHGKILVT